MVTTLPRWVGLAQRRVCLHFLASAVLTTQNRTRENLRSGEILVCRDQWPVFLYAHHTYDAEDPWCGLLRSHLLICLSGHTFSCSPSLYHCQAYKHVFTSPSSVNKDPKATQSGNARLHGMNCITITSIAYIATQVCQHHIFVAQ